MIHYLFNNIFLEGQNKEVTQDTNSGGYKFPINTDNEHVLLYLLDIYDKVHIPLTHPGATNILDYKDK
jgi:hypothetical protein